MELTFDSDSDKNIALIGVVVVGGGGELEKCKYKLIRNEPYTNASGKIAYFAQYSCILYCIFTKFKRCDIFVIISGFIKKWPFLHSLDWNKAIKILAYGAIITNKSTHGSPWEN